MNQNKIDDFIGANPKVCLSVLFIVFFITWQTLACMLGILVFILLKKYPLPLWIIILLSLVLIGFELYFSQTSFALLIKNGFYFNGKFLENLLINIKMHGEYLLNNYSSIPYVYLF
jgi:hypothetical protein